jgi:hypothetical protein
MKSRLVAHGFGLLVIAAVGSLEASTFGRHVGLPVTGQTVCWDPSGDTIPCAGTGQDGDHQKGWILPDDYPRFLDNGDGTVIDRLTGLVWLKDANCFGTKNWTHALAAANGLAQGSCGLTDGSVAGDWRLPNLKELQSLIDYQNASPALPTGHPFSGVHSFFWDYWSSVSDAGAPSLAWYVFNGPGVVDVGAKTNGFLVWPLRGGQ